LFESERVIALNKMGGVNPAEGFRIPKDVRAVPIAPWAGRGEDEPIASLRMKRDGWVLADPGSRTEYRRGAKYSWEFVRAERWRKTCRKMALERRLLGIGEINGPWYAREHSLFDADDNLVLDFGRSDWADWSRSGELLFAREGRVFRVPIDRNGKVGGMDELIDLRSLKFEQVPPPPAALTWDRRVTGKRIT
jgi:hypothetical protein